jgi:hypothetical protein
VGLVVVPRIDRPRPPSYLADAAVVEEQYQFVPAPDVAAWMRYAFFEDVGPFYNNDHSHLKLANIGVLWTNVLNHRQQRNIIGMAEMPMNRGHAWARGRAERQLIDWFGSIPDFVITLSAPYCAEANDASFCALTDHECYHCAQELDAYGCPKWHRNGTPCFAMRDHDVTEFVGVVRRWGPRAAGAGVEAMVAAAIQPPQFSGADIAAACGTCLAKAA